MEIFEILFELFGTVFLELEFDLISSYNPEKKFKKWQIRLLKFFGLLISLSILTLITIGIWFMVEPMQFSLTGLILILIGLFLLITQVIIYIVTKHKKKKNEFYKNLKDIMKKNNGQKIEQEYKHE